MQVGKQDEFQHKRAFILMMTLKCLKTIKNSNDEMALVNWKNLNILTKLNLSIFNEKVCFAKLVFDQRHCEKLDKPAAAKHVFHRKCFTEIPSPKPPSKGSLANANTNFQSCFLTVALLFSCAASL